MRPEGILSPTAAVARTVQASGLAVAGYRLAFLISTGIALLAVILVAFLFRSQVCQEDLAR
jgi:hypothetical protein